MSTSRRKITRFPWSLRQLRCPICKNRVTAMLVDRNFEPRETLKYLLPCQHQITAEQETKMVEDIFRNELENEGPVR